MLIALEAGLQKLRDYYALTDQPKAGNIYVYGTILAPKDKLQYFKTKDWLGGPEGSDKTWAEHYQNTLQNRIKEYQPEEDNTFVSESFLQGSELEAMFDDERETDLNQDELTRYLQAGKSLLLSLLI